MNQTQVELNELAEGLELIEETLLNNVGGGLAGNDCSGKACAG
jgi:hypothetical protein